jgi:hypothetical protein
MSDLACKFYGPMSTYFTLVSALSTAVIASCMRNIFFNRANQTQGHLVKVHLKHYLFVFVLPLFLVWWPAITHSFGKTDDDIFCWIKLDHDSKYRNHIGLMWVLVTFYLPLFLIIVYNSFVYISVYLHVRSWRVSTPSSINK